MPANAPPDRSGSSVDAGVQLLADLPISGAAEDLLARRATAQRLVELACAAPLAASRAVGLVGPSGAGKTSIVRMAVELLAQRSELAVVSLDASHHAGAQALIDALLGHLTEFFLTAGVLDTSDRLRDQLVRYGWIVSDIAKIAGVKVDVAGALSRSPEAVRAEIVEMTQEVGKRIVIVLDHVDRFAEREMTATLEALRFYAAIPYVAIVLPLDRRAVARRLSDEDDRDPEVLERLLQVELAVPPADRVLLARLVGGGLGRLAERLGRDLDAALPLFDPDHPEDGLGLDLVQTPRDAKRAVNALSASLALMPPGADPRTVCLELLLRLLVPVIDGPRLDARAYLRDPAARAALLGELERAVSGHRRAAAARAALRALFAVSELSAP
jgi:energy-coupling factor transporter ATP-binding protein EcfA2